MRITIIGGPFQPWPPAPCGSIERIWQGLAAQFARAGHDVTAICQRHPTQPLRGTIENVRYIRKWRFSRTGSIKRDLLLDLLFSLRMLPLIPKSDIIVPHSFWLPYLLPRLRPRAGRVVAHVQRFPKRQIGLYLRTACITTVSDAIANAIAEQCPQAKDLIRVIPNPIHDVFVPPPEPRKRTQGGVILYTGRVHPEKGLNLLVAAYKKLRAQYPELRLNITGPSEIKRGGGGPEFVRELQTLAAGEPIEINPSIDSIAKLAAALQSADYYCYPSVAEKGEASPVAPLEAMATGLVPVVSDLAQFRGYLQPGRNGLVFDHHAANAADLLAEQLDQLISNPDLRAEMSSRAVATAADFGYPTIADAYLQQFQRLLDEDYRGDKGAVK